MPILSYFRKSGPSAPFTGDDAARMKLYKKLRFQLSLIHISWSRVAAYVIPITPRPTIRPCGNGVTTRPVSYTHLVLKKANTLRFSTSATGSGSLTLDTFGWLKIPPGLSKAGTLLTYAFALGAGFSTGKAANGSGFSRCIPITKVSVHR